MIPNEIIINVCIFLTGKEYYLINKYVYEIIVKYEKHLYWYDMYSKIIKETKIKLLLLDYNVYYNWKQEYLRIKKSQSMEQCFDWFNEPVDLTNVKQLFLINHNIGFLAKEIVKLVSLEGIYFSSNMITYVPEQIGFLKNLKVINFSNNKIKIIPKEIENLNCLEEIDFSFNEIEYVPPEIGNLFNLKFLLLNNNLIKTIPGELSKLYRKKIQQVHLQNNKISQIPQELNNLVNFNIIYL